MLSHSQKGLIKSKIKRSMEISSDEFDIEIDDQISACEMDLNLAGVENEASPLYEQAIIFYVRAYLRPDNNFDRYIKAFERLSNKMALTKKAEETQNVQS